ncbi:MAG: biliverdin-producing heme oxygenase [Gemmatimonadales bacterium]
MTHPSPDSPAPTAPPNTVSGVLREQTAEHHKRAERSEFQRRLLKGEITLPDYIAWLGEMHHLYARLEALLAAAGPACAMETAAWRRTPELLRDLTHFGATPGAAPPLPATAALLVLLDRLGEASAPALLGVLYVLEGSTNGSRYIARGLTRAFGLAPNAGLAFLDPYGEAQPDRWRHFKAELDSAVPLAHAPALVAAARSTFEAVTAIGADVLTAAAVATAGPDD